MIASSNMLNHETVVRNDMLQERQEEYFENGAAAL